MVGSESLWIDLVLARADELRRAGVLAIGCGGCTAHLAALPAPIPEGKIDAPDPSADYGLDPLHDPHSYPTGHVPGYTIKRDVPIDLEEP